MDSNNPKLRIKYKLLSTFLSIQIEYIFPCFLFVLTFFQVIPYQSLSKYPSYFISVDLMICWAIKKCLLKNQLIYIQNNMQQLQYTPSVCFNFDNTTNKRDMSAEFLFELSCTNQKNAVKPFEPHVQTFDLDQQVILTNPSKLKTEDFFEEFQHNFIVTFDQDESPTKLFRKTGEFRQSPSHIQEYTSQEVAITLEDDLEHIDLALLPQKSKASNQKKSLKESKNIESNNKKSIKSASTKQKDSPIQFQIKKRTVFKSKENIANNGQHFKITKKKLVNQQTFDFIAQKARSCKSSKPKTAKDNKERKSFTSQLVITKNKKTNSDFPYENLKIDTNRTSSIFLDHKQAREDFRSTTLDNWKRKFNMQKKSIEQKTNKRGNIFQYPFRF